MSSVAAGGRGRKPRPMYVYFLTADVRFPGRTLLKVWICANVAAAARKGAAPAAAALARHLPNRSRTVVTKAA
jgi:hypothetical protein